MDLVHRAEEEVVRDADYVSEKTGMPAAMVVAIFFVIALLIVGGLGFCVWRFLRKRRITREQIKKAQDEQGLVDEMEEPDILDEEPIKVGGGGGAEISGRIILGNAGSKACIF